MQIDYLKINGFGKLENKEINFNNNINLIQGKNESGKTTLLKFISSMFYGISKNKNGKDFSDFDRYKPWLGKEFSGKIRYKLDNGKSFEIYREFSKKNPKIYNENLEEISSTYSIDKTKGSQFFYEQTRIDEQLFFSTSLVEQQNVVLDDDNQLSLTQKITNILSSGENNISYKKSMEKLNKKLLEEVGTDRTVGRPINILNEKINELNKQKTILEASTIKSDEINNNINLINNELIEKENIINLIKEINNDTIEFNIDEEKININNNLLEENNNKINEIKNKLNNIKNNSEKKQINKLNLFVFPLVVFLNIILTTINFNSIFNYIFIFCSTIYFFTLLFIYFKKRKYLKNKNKLNVNEKNKLNYELEILLENSRKKREEIELLSKEINNKKIENKNNLFNKYENKINNNLLNDLLIEPKNNLLNKLEILNNNYNNLKIKLSNLENENENININLNKKLKIEESLDYLIYEKKELINLEKIINLTKETLEYSYNKMKNNLTPKFTKDLSSIVENISNGKYLKCDFKDSEGLTVELDNGEYVNCNKLSLGTIDQLYLSLRLSAMQEISQEKMPIILDESFAYYDTNRLKNILNYLNNNLNNNQIIIFSCTNREKAIFDELNIKYNLINL